MELMAVENSFTSATFLFTSFMSAKGCSLLSLQIITNSHLMFLILRVPG